MNKLGKARLKPAAPSWRQAVAIAGEQAAQAFYRQQGYAILACNWRAGRRGEIDLIVKSAEGLVVFVEVKTRCLKSLQPGIVAQGFEAVHKRKQATIIRCAKIFLSLLQENNAGCRFDVVMIIYELPHHAQATMTNSLNFLLPEPIISQVRAAFTA